MSDFRFETIEFECGIVAIFYYKNEKIMFPINETELQEIIESIFKSIPFDQQKIITEKIKNVF